MFLLENDYGTTKMDHEFSLFIVLRYLSQMRLRRKSRSEKKQTDEPKLSLVLFVTKACIITVVTINAVKHIYCIQSDTCVDQELAELLGFCISWKDVHSFKLQLFHICRNFLVVEHTGESTM